MYVVVNGVALILKPMGAALAVPGVYPLASEPLRMSSE
jgi:hypothetical protein